MRELTDLELSILMVLADNKGHALWELVELLGKEKSNLIITLNRLEEETELTDPFILDFCDIIDSKYLGLKFHDPQDSLSQYIRDQIRPKVRLSLDRDINNFSFYHYFELNRLLNDPNLFNEKRFAHVELNERIRDLIVKNPTGGRASIPQSSAFRGSLS